MAPKVQLKERLLDITANGDGPDPETKQDAT